MTSVRFSTDDLPERDRLAAWREHFARTVLGVDVEPLPDAPVRATMTLAALPGLPIASGSLSAARYERSPPLIADGNDDVYLLTATGSVCMMSQRGREFELGDGDAALISGSDVSTFVSSATMHFLNVRIPVASLAPLAANLDRAMTRPIPRNAEALKLLTGYVALLKQGSAPQTPELWHLAVTHVHDLVALAIGATRDAAEIAKGRGLRAARLNAIKDDIAKNLSHHDLTVGAVAGRHGVTPRYIQMLFETDGTTFSAFVLGQRLARAHRLLKDPRYAGSTVSAIGFEIGFGDLSYFHRSFRRRYGATPSEIRRGEAT